jgi:transposase-like protein
MSLEKTAEKKKTKVTRKAERMIGAEERAQAVLAVWTDRCKPAAVCRELGIPWVTFSQWQDRAMEGMLQALEPRASLMRGASLSPRLQHLLSKRQKGTSNLSERLLQIQKIKKTEGDPKME